ncbi:hypothetical protein ACRALDRAFT_1075330 [Sodiomyces alcalophilus JCM 7366]|uniref:uncharacterized protein n=1 Tax=Sodiomyces alcalophilus JCM 7366 TaxID=591952 RepID=UPI0039B43AC7
MESREKPQACQSTYAPRLRTYNNALLTPVFPAAATGPISRTTKRGTTIINYAEDGYDDLDDDEDDNRRRPSSLRNQRKEETPNRQDLTEKFGKDTAEPVELQGIWRDWLAKGRYARTDTHNIYQASLPVTLVPVRIDLEIPAFVPAPAWPPTPGYDASLPQYRPGEMTVPYRLRDIFLWNLHESAITTDYFAQVLVQDLDLPNRLQTIQEISKQIRTQLEEYAGVAMHPLFHNQTRTLGPGETAAAAAAAAGTPKPNDEAGNTPTPAPPGPSRADTPAQSAGGPATPSDPKSTTAPARGVAAQATAITPDSDDYNPDDTYRCIITLNITLAQTLYTDKFEWSLLHPPGTAEAFAKQTCADLGLTGEWVSAMTHAIYEAVLRLKKEACEAGGLVGGWGGLAEIANDAAHGAEAGWRYDPDSLGDAWQPRVETLTKEELEKREGDRERAIRRLRRETARFSSTSGMVGGVPFSGFGSVVDTEEERMGRGERTKKKRRFRGSLSPPGRSGTPGGRGTPDVGYGGAGGGALTEQERMAWRCDHCGIQGTSVWAVRDGPNRPRSLCNNCGLVWERHRSLPFHAKNLHTPIVRAG